MTLLGLFSSTLGCRRALKRHYVTFYITLLNLISHPKWLFPTISSVDGSHLLLRSSSEIIIIFLMIMQMMMVLLTCTSIRHLKPVNLYRSDDITILVWKQLKKKKKKELSVNLSCPRRKILCTRNSASAPLMLRPRPKLGQMLFFYYWASLISSGNTGVSIITIHSLLQMQMWWSRNFLLCPKKTFVKRQRKKKSRYLTIYM